MFNIKGFSRTIGIIGSDIFMRNVDNASYHVDARSLHEFEGIKK